MPRGIGIVAHRGASGLMPEHTAAAYQQALSDRADGVECDVQLTKDGHLVCVHDRTVDRTSNGFGLVSDYTLAQLRELDFGSWHSPGQSASILTLKDLLSMVREHMHEHNRPVTVFIETKYSTRHRGGVEAQIVNQLDHFGWAHPQSVQQSRVVVMSFSVLSCARIRRAAPNLPVIVLAKNHYMIAKSSAKILNAYGIGPSITDFRSQSDGMVQRTDSMVQGNRPDRVVYCWTVDEPEDMQLCRNRGVRWMATNWPERARAVLDE